MGNVLVVRSKLSLGAQASVILAFAAWLIGPLAIAGDMHWREGWIYYVALGLGLLAHGMSVRRRNPELWRARREIGAGTPSWDLVWNAVFWWLMAGAPLLAAFEHRKHAGLLPPWTLALGALLLWGGLAVSALAMAHNVFFEGTVRLPPSRLYGPVFVGSGNAPAPSLVMGTPRWSRNYRVGGVSHGSRGSTPAERARGLRGVRAPGTVAAPSRALVTHQLPPSRETKPRRRGRLQRSTKLRISSARAMVSPKPSSTSFSM